MVFPWLQERYPNIRRDLVTIFPNLGLNGLTFKQFWVKACPKILLDIDFYNCSTEEAIVLALINQFGIPEKRIREAYLGKPSGLMGDKLFYEKLDAACAACSRYDAESNSNKLYYVYDDRPLYRKKGLQGDKLLIEGKHREALEFYFDFLKEIHVFHTDVVYFFCKALIFGGELYIAYQFLMEAATELYAKYGISVTPHGNLLRYLIKTCKSFVASQDIEAYRNAIENIVEKPKNQDWKYTELVSKEKILLEARNVYENAVYSKLCERS